MFNEISEKVMGWAQILGYLTLLGGVIGGLIFLLNDNKHDDYIGIILLASGIVSFVYMLTIYAIGQITEDIREIRKVLVKKDVSTEDLPEL